MARISKEDQELVKKKIISVSRKLFNDVGFDKTSTKMISKEAGIAEGTIFNYFGTKDEIFFEVFYKDYIDDVKSGLPRNINEKDIINEINENICNVLSKMLRLPKRVLLEMGIVTIKIAKKKPEFFKKMAKIDFQYMEEVEKYLDQLILDDVLISFDSKKMSEIIFGSIIFELSMYLYKKENTKDEFKYNLKEKLDILLKGYIKGGQ
jgi:AcrR family transcriptional regulator